MRQLFGFAVRLAGLSQVAVCRGALRRLRARCVLVVVLVLACLLCLWVQSTCYELRSPWTTRRAGAGGCRAWLWARRRGEHRMSVHSFTPRSARRFTRSLRGPRARVPHHWRPSVHDEFREDARIAPAVSDGLILRVLGSCADFLRCQSRFSGTHSLPGGSTMDRNGPCKSLWLGYFVDREVEAIW